MATINGEAFFATKATQWGASGSESMFPADYINAVNYTLSEYSTVMNLASIPTIVNAESNITIDNSADEHVISKGVDMWLARFGNFQARGVDPAEADKVFQGALTVAMTRRDQATAKAATVEDDVIGLI